MYEKDGKSYWDATHYLLSRAKDLSELVIKLGRSARQKAGIRVRQPLSEVVVIAQEDWDWNVAMIFQSHILDTLNVEKVLWTMPEEYVTEYPNLYIGSKQERGITVYIHTVPNLRLVHKGMVREFIREANKHRKKIELNLDDRVSLYIDCTKDFMKAALDNKETIFEDVIATSINWGEIPDLLETTSFDIYNESIIFAMEKREA